MSFALSMKLSSVRLCQAHEQQVRRPAEISQEISLLVDGEDITRLEPSVFGECLRSGLLVVEVTLRNAASLDPKLARLSDAAIRTILTNDPSLQARHEKTR